jgi:hypothetical protein
VPSDIKPSVPKGCEVTFVQILSRHGARDPTAGKSLLYGATISRVQESVTEYSKGYDFIKDYDYTLGADQLTQFGEQQMVDSGAHAYRRYKTLASKSAPFIRASGQKRVIDSAQNWTQGYFGAQLADGSDPNEHYSGSILILPETHGFNNTLSHGTCPAFEDGAFSRVGDDAQKAWMEMFTAPITARLNENMPGANLSALETTYMMDLCPFNTVADPKGNISEFCRLFTLDEWKSYDYYQSLGKYYGFNNGNAMGPTQGVGFVNELIARLTGQPVEDHTTTNSTLDDSPKSFPLDRKVYADFSHDNDMTTIYGALGLYNATTPLPKMTRQSPKDASGYSAAWTVPFAARMYVEKMQCGDSDQELVRILVNDRVVPLQSCGADKLGRCELGAFVESLGFARSGGLWDECFE